MLTVTVTISRNYYQRYHRRKKGGKWLKPVQSKKKEKLPQKMTVYKKYGGG